MDHPSNSKPAGDPVAARTEWTPLKNGGSSFCSHRLRQVDSNRVRFDLTIGGFLFGLVFILFGGAGGYLAAVGFKTEAASPAILIPAVAGSVFGAVGILLIYFMSTPRVFDKQSGLYWKRRKAPDQLYAMSTQKDTVQLNDIHALQIIPEYCSGSEDSFYSYELNLVLKDARRINVVDHGNLDKLRQDTEKLSEFIGVPVWDSAEQ